MREVAIVSIARTPVGRAHKGNLRDTRPDTLGGIVVKEAIKRASGIDGEQIEDVVLGCAMPEAEQGMNVARQATFLGGLPASSASMTINRYCSSGLQSISIAASSIAAGASEAAIAGGVESMSMVPMGGNKPSVNPELLENYPESYTSMGITAENVARKFEITREDQDAFALRSHQRAIAAQKAGKFDDEIVPVKTTVYGDEGAKQVEVRADEGPRADTSLEKLAKLKPAFHRKGSVTAGNSSQVSDGAGAAVLMTTDAAKAAGLKPLAIFRQFVVAGVPPEVMGIGPVPAIRKLMDKTGLKLDDIDCFEINEAFAAQAHYCINELGIDAARVNPNGGAIALGHPLGATGAILTAKLIHEMARSQHRYGVVSMCVGGGMGAAGLFERV